MRNRHFITVLATIAIIIISLSQTSFAQRGEGARGHTGQYSKRMLQKLDLTKKQKEQIYEIKRENRINMHQIKSKLRDFRFELSVKLEDYPLDAAAIDKLVNQISHQSKNLLKERVNFIKKLQQILAEEQIKKLNYEKMMQWKSKRKYGKQNMKKGQGRRNQQTSKTPIKDSF